MNYNIKQLLAECESIDLEKSIDSIYDLGYLLERHFMKRYGDDSYFILFNDKSVYDILITDDECNEIVRFLFYTILNQPDRSIATAWCLRKCAELSTTVAVYNCIDLYLTKDDDTVAFLLDTLSLSHSYPQVVDEQLVKTFLKVQENGLPKSKEVSSNEIKSYLKHIELFPEKTQVILKELGK